MGFGAAPSARTGGEVTERTVLVTAVGGGGVGEQIVKALRLADRPYRIVGTDIDRNSLGLQEVDLPVNVPPASASEYVDTMVNICARLEVRGIFPGSEPELVALASARAALASRRVVLFANSDAVIATGLDKAKTARFLEEHGFRPPESLAVSDPEELARVPFLPAILKPVTAAGGSANVFVAQTRRELEHLGSWLLRDHPTVLVQEYVAGAGDEYTVGVLSDLDGVFINSIAVRRNLVPAFSRRSREPNRTGNPTLGEHLVVSNGISQGEIGPFPAVAEACERVAEALGSRGPLNLQCRLAGGEVRVFEINPRFSGTTSLRALSGFNEPDLLYRRHVEQESLAPRFAYRSCRVARGLREVIIDPALEEASLGAGDFRLTFPALPFIYRPLDQPTNGAGLPDVLPFTLTVESATGLIRQSPTPLVADALARAYGAGSELPGLMEERDIGREYADDFLVLLSEATGKTAYDRVRVLEIACGTGYLLHRLQALGATVLGIEPGPQGHRGPTHYGVPVVHGFFPCDGVKGPFELIVMYAFLEHVPDPVALLAQLRTHLAPGGRVALVVPDADLFLKEGDASILFHEHYSYFTAATLAATLRRADASSVDIRHSALSRLLFALVGFDGDTTEPASAAGALAGSLALAHRFRKLINRTTEKIAQYLAKARAAEETVAVYVPARFVNYVAIGRISLDGVRFFDDSIALRDSYYPGIPIRVETLDELVARPCQRILVMSSSFGARIAARVRPLVPATTEITLLADLLR
jgi:carbamoyl-phosphate synthase large subunit